MQPTRQNRPITHIKSFLRYVELYVTLQPKLSVIFSKNFEDYQFPPDLGSKESRVANYLQASTVWFKIKNKQLSESDLYISSIVRRQVAVKQEDMA